MNCRSCGTQLPPGANACPNCGTPTFTYNPGSGGSPYDPTAVTYPSGNQPESSPYGAWPNPSPPDASPQSPSTAYGSNPYPPTAPAGPQGPYTPPPTPPAGGPQGPYSAHVTPWIGTEPSYPPPVMPPGPQGQKQPRRLGGGLIALIAVLVVLLIAGSGLIYYTTVYQPNVQHAQATATAIAQLTGAARAEATSSAQALATKQAEANATATAAVENPYTQSGTLVFSDPLSDNSKGHRWDEDPLNCGFTSFTYRAKAPDVRYSDYCIANNTDFNDFAFEVQMQIIKGDAGGIVFRVESTNPANKLYAFYIGQNGSYELDSINGSNVPTLASGSSSAIKQGLNQTNVIAVVAKGTSITMYVNQQQVASVTDSTFSHGQIGVYVVPFNNHPTAVAFTNARVWRL